MVLCPNCGRKTEGDYCQWCGYPVQAGVRYSARKEEPVMEARLRTSGLAVASMILGILSVIFCWAPFFIGSIMGVLAIIFGGVAMSQTSRDPTLGGRGMAIAGLVCGIVGLAILVILIIAVISIFYTF